MQVWLHALPPRRRPRRPGEDLPMIIERMTASLRPLVDLTRKTIGSCAGLIASREWDASERTAFKAVAGGAVALLLLCTVRDLIGGA